MASNGELEREFFEYFYPLSPMQEGMLFQSLTASGADPNIIQITGELREEIEPSQFAEAWRKVVQRWEALRTSFDVTTPAQRVHRQVRLPFEFRDLATEPAERRATALEEIAHNERQSFDLSVAPLMRLALVRCDKESSRLIWTLHHLIGDAQTFTVVLREVFAAYETLRRNEPVNLPRAPRYRDFVEDARKRVVDEAFWRKKFAGFPVHGKPIFGLAGQVSGQQQIEVSERVTAQLRELCAVNGFSLTTVIQGAWSLLLSRYGGEDDLVIGVVRSGRRSGIEGVENLAGLTITTLPLRVRVNAAANAIDWLKDLGAQWRELRGHEHVSLAEIQRCSGLQGPLFETLVSVQDPPWDKTLREQGESWKQRTFRIENRTAYAASLDVYARETLQMTLNYAGMAEAKAGRVLQHLEILLSEIATDARRPVARIPILTSEERKKISEWNATAVAIDLQRRADELVDEQARRHPEALAVQCGAERLTYRELDDKGNRLAAQLQNFGVGPDVLVCIYMERSIDLVVGMLAVLKAGGAYVPIDPGYPKNRVEYMVGDSQARILLTHRKLAKGLELGATRVISADGLSAADEVPAITPANSSTSDNLAYVIYTSGSTGKPKGVSVEHGSLLNLIQWHQRTYGITAADRGTQIASPAFDAAVWEIWPYLTAGASIHIPDEETRLSPTRLVRWVSEQGITVAFLPTPLAEAAMEQDWPEECALRVLLTGGDRLRRRPPAKARYALVNHYGPTENTVVTTAGVVRPDGIGTPTIGRPISNVQVQVVDRNFQPVPIGASGELCVMGKGLARGYWNQPQLTTERFVNSIDGTRMYRTGDLVRFCDDGELEFLGRLDGQVKIRGYRIETGEIEYALRTHVNVADAVVVAQCDDCGVPRLAAYVVTRREVEPTELRDYLRASLPDYMVPDVFVPLDALPLTANGKIDRDGLPRVEFGLDGTQYAPPRTANEDVLAGIWCDVLGRDRVGIDDNFFALGGHSLSATRVITRARNALGAELPLNALFKFPTIRQLAEHLNAARNDGEGIERSAEPPGEEMELSFGQERLWFFEQFEPGKAVNNIALCLEVDGKLNKAALEAAVAEMVQRHESLRTVFLKRNGRPVGKISEAESVAIAQHDLTQFPESERERAATRIAEAAAHDVFDLTTGPLLRLQALQLAPHLHWLVLTMHHIVSDGWSLSVIYRELAALYEAHVRNDGKPLPAVRIQYRDYARWQRRQFERGSGEADLSYWRKKLGGRLPVLDLPGDRPRPPLQTYDGAVVPITIEPELVCRLEAAARREDVTLYMLLLAGLKAVLYRYTGEEDLIVGTPVAGRTQPEAENLIGMFVNMLPMRTSVSGEISFRELLHRVRETALGAYAHQQFPFEKLVDALHVERDLSRSPIFQVMLALQNAPSEFPAFAETRTRARMIHTGTAKHDLTVSLEKVGESLAGYVEFNRDLFDPCTVERFVGHLNQLLRGAAENPETQVARLPLLTAPEREQLLIGWNATEVPYPQNRCVHELFEEQARKTPDAIAAVFEDEELTYRELNQRANAVATHLRSLGAGPEARVGICLHRSLEMLVALLGILKAGAAYVPLDPGYPRERLSFMVEDAQLHALVTDESLAGTFDQARTKVVSIETVRPVEVENSPAAEATPDNLAYVIYTSGSTGKPKGVMIRHRNVVNFFAGMDQVIGTKPGVWLAVTSICFDISVLELLWTLTRGFKVVIQSDQEGLRSNVARPATAHRKVDFSLFYFGSDAGKRGADAYKLLIEGAKFADQHGFSAVWTPERHFHPFGGLFPSPAVTSAALAMVTQRIQIRAGSAVLPLHHPARVTEDWALVDNLSKGRAAVSFASGWHAKDFILAPDRYTDRKKILLREIEMVRRLWRGEEVEFPGQDGKTVPIRIYPQPIQRELPIWLTSSGDPETFRMAAEARANLLTHLSGQSLEHLSGKIEVYRAAWRKAGQPGRGHVSLMLHTFVGEDLKGVWEKVRKPFCDYLRTYRDLSRSAHTTSQPVAPASAGQNLDGEIETMLNSAVDRYLGSSGLFGSAEDCVETVRRLQGVGVDEIACLVDFGVEADAVLGSLRYLDKVRELANRGRPASAPGDYTIAEQIRRHGVTHLQCTPSLMGMLLQETGAREAIASVNTILIGGEALTTSLLQQLQGPQRVINMYGPTETTVWSTSQVIGPDAPITIGRPIANTKIYILDAFGQPAPVGVRGELCIGGAGVVRGYLNRPELTADRFVHNSFGDQSGERMYRTGDLARYRADGTIEFLGRVDHQVKLRGFRIELGEIEAVLRQFPGVQETVVVVRELKANDQRLVAYVVADKEIEVAQLRRSLKEKLPDYMVPSIFSFLPKLPLTPNGKIDRKALPEPSSSSASSSITVATAESDVERKVAEIWRDLLHVERVGLNDNFFDLGGHSLLMVQAQARLSSAFGTEIPVIRLFQYPTVSALAKLLGEPPRDGVPLDRIQARARLQRQAFARRPGVEVSA